MNVITEYHNHHHYPQSNMKIFYLLRLLPSLFFYSQGYTLLTNPTRQSTLLEATQKHKTNPSFVRAMFTAAAITFGVDSLPIHAYESNRDIVSEPSSSFQISTDVKILDMSLPTYGSISKPKFDVDDIKGVDEVLPASKSSGGSLSASSRKNPKKERAVKAEAQDDSKSGANESTGTGKYDIVDMNMPSYSGSTTVKDKSIFSF